MLNRGAGSELVACAHQQGATPLDVLERTILALGVGPVVRVVEVLRLQQQAQAGKGSVLSEAVADLRVDDVLADDVTQRAVAGEVADLADEVRTLALAD